MAIGGVASEHVADVGQECIDLVSDMATGRKPALVSKPLDEILEQSKLGPVISFGPPPQNDKHDDVRDGQTADHK